jgi:peptidyl-prolyl cis-trans isomerase D
MTKKQMVDAKVADAAFALEKGAFSAPVEGTFSTVIVRAVDVTPGSTKTLDEVKAELRDALALEKAEEEVQNLIDTVERARSRGANLKETAEKANLKVKEIAAVDQSGKDADGKPVDALKEAAPLLARIFQTDVGIEADGVELPGGYGWFEVQAITPAKPKPLESIKEEVTKAWTEVEKAKSLRTFAQTLVERVSKGETIDAIAKDLGLEAKTSKPLKRSESADDLPAPAVNLMFALGKGVAGQSEAGKDKGRVVFVVKDITAPPALTDEDRKQLGLELSRQMSADLSGELLGALQERSGVKVNQEALKRVMGITTQ